MIDDYIWRYSYYLTYPDRNTTRAFIGRAVKVGRTLVMPLHRLSPFLFNNFSSIQVIDDALESTMMGRTDVKMALWSAHDSTVSPASLLTYSKASVFYECIQQYPEINDPLCKSHCTWNPQRQKNWKWVLRLLNWSWLADLFVNSYYNNEAFVVPGCPDHEPCPIATFRHSYKVCSRCRPFWPFRTFWLFLVIAFVTIWWTGNCPFLEIGHWIHLFVKLMETTSIQLLRHYLHQDCIPQQLALLLLPSLLLSPLPLHSFPLPLLCQSFLQEVPL